MTGRTVVVHLVAAWAHTNSMCMLELPVCALLVKNMCATSFMLRKQYLCLCKW